METPKEKVMQLINKELEENYELINDEKNYYHDDIQAVKIQTNFLAKMLLEVEEIPDPTAQLQADKEELLEALEESNCVLANCSFEIKGETSYQVGVRLSNNESLIQKHKQ